MNHPSKKTVLHDWHRQQGAKMADFGGYEMPLWYSSAKKEHLAVLNNAGLFDTSHMAIVTVCGEDAFDLLQYAFTNDLSQCIGMGKKPLAPGRCVYGAFLDASGGVVDDAIIFQITTGDYMVVVNSGMGAVIATHLTDIRNGRRVAVTDLSDQVGKIDIQGPDAVSILKSVLVDPESVLDAFPYFAFKGHFDPNASGAEAVKFVNGATAMVSRTGYTGEVGFEIFCALDDVQPLWELMMEAGGSKGLQACGLAARDSLRAGAVLPLSHQDIGPWPFVNHPWPFALPYGDDAATFTKTFIGAEALLNVPDTNYTYAFAGFDLRKVSAGESVDVMDDNGHTFGTVLTCVTDMGIDRYQGQIFSVASLNKPADVKFKGLCCGFVKVDRLLTAGQRIILKDKRRSIMVEIVEDIRPDRTARSPLKHFL